jgi:hypothetical protein
MFRKFGGLAAGIARRRALTLIPATASGAVVARETLAGEHAAELLPGTDLCRIAPCACPEPRDLEPALVRRDITEGRPGVATLVRLQIVDAALRPIVNARVDLWHCDASGTYAAAVPEGETFLRGTQFSDEHGVVEFATIFPGRCNGRPARVHFAVTPTLGAAATVLGDIELPEAVSAYIHDTVPAYGHAATDLADATTLAPVAATLGSASEAYLAQVIIGVATDADPAEATLH